MLTDIVSSMSAMHSQTQLYQTSIATVLTSPLSKVMQSSIPHSLCSDELIFIHLHHQYLLQWRNSAQSDGTIGNHDHGNMFRSTVDHEYA